MAEFLHEANASSSKASFKGLLDGETLYRIGRACRAAGRYNRALLMYETALIMQPDGPKDASATSTYLECGEMWLRLRAGERALECFRRVMKRSMEVSLGTGDVLCEIAACYRLLRMPEEESRCMKLACSDPSHKPIRVTNLIKVAWYKYERDKDTKRALRELTEANALKKTSEGLYTLGRVHFKMENFDAADACYVEACKMEPTSPKIWLEIGNLYLNGFRLPIIAVKAYGRAKELASFLQRREDALRTEHGYGYASEGQTKFSDSADVKATQENAIIGRGDAFNDLGQVSSALREYEQVPETGRVQIRKLKIIIWAVVALQRAFRRHRALVHAEIASGSRRPALSPAAPPKVETPKMSEALLAKLANRPKTEVKPAKNKYESITRKITRGTTVERAPMDMLKDFSIQPAKEYEKPSASPGTKSKKGGDLFNFSSGKKTTPVTKAPSTGRKSLFK
jgi:tetratricopeptide (TPR) repeat protein